MPPFAFSVSKKITWRNVEELFSNVYHYDMPSGVSDTQLTTLLDNLVTIDKSCHAPGVTYVSGRVWGPTNVGEAGNETRVIKDYTGGGTLAQSGGSIYAEAAVVVQWYMGRIGAGGRKVFLRKYFHAQVLPVSNTGNTGAVALASGNKSPFATAGDNAKFVSYGAGTANLCSHLGAGMLAGASTQVLDYLHIRQFKQ